MGIRIEKAWYFFGSPIVIYPCPNCEGELKSPVADIGTEDACPECQRNFVVPGETEFQIYMALRSKRPVKVDNSMMDQTEDIEDAHPSLDGFYKAVILKTRPFNFDREVDDRIRYYYRFKYFAPILNNNPKIVLGVSGNTCPYCEHKLQKKKCVNCGKSHRSRSSVQDYKIWVNIREEWVQPIDEQREIRDGGHAVYLDGVRLRAAIKDVLMARNGEVSTTWPSQVIEVESVDKSSEFLALEREKNEYARRHLWGQYRSAILDQAVILSEQRMTKESLAKFIEVVYLDLNGAFDFLPVNVEPTPEVIREWKKISKEWDKGLSDMIFCDHVFEHAYTLGLSQIEIKEIFIKIATETQKRLGCPLKPSTAYNKVWKERKEHERDAE
jgi:Zn-finger nucleic acid-binding protein